MIVYSQIMKKPGESLDAKTAEARQRRVGKRQKTTKDSTSDAKRKTPLSNITSATVNRLTTPQYSQSRDNTAIQYVKGNQTFQTAQSCQKLSGGNLLGNYTENVQPTQINSYHTHVSIKRNANCLSNAETHVKAKKRPHTSKNNETDTPSTHNTQNATQRHVHFSPNSHENNHTNVSTILSTTHHSNQIGRRHVSGINLLNQFSDTIDDGKQTHTTDELRNNSKADREPLKNRVTNIHTINQPTINETHLRHQKYVCNDTNLQKENFSSPIGMDSGRRQESGVNMQNPTSRNIGRGFQFFTSDMLSSNYYVDHHVSKSNISFDNSKKIVSSNIQTKEVHHSNVTNVANLSGLQYKATSSKQFRPIQEYHTHMQTPLARNIQPGFKFFTSDQLQTKMNVGTPVAVIGGNNHTYRTPKTSSTQAASVSVPALYTSLMDSMRKSAPHTNRSAKHNAQNQSEQGQTSTQPTPVNDPEHQVRMHRKRIQTDADYFAAMSHAIPQPDQEDVSQDDCSDDNDSNPSDDTQSDSSSEEEIQDIAESEMQGMCFFYLFNTDIYCFGLSWCITDQQLC
jgi:hypothetical protein